MKLLNETALKHFQKSWDDAKRTNGWTQAKIAAALKIAQPSFNQYLKGTIPLNLEFVLRYCRVLRIDPQQLGVSDEIVRPEVSAIALRVLFSTSGIFYENGEVRMVTMVTAENAKAFLVEVDSEYRNLPRGSFLACVQDPCKVGNLIVGVSKDKQIVVGTLKKAGDKWMVVQPLVTGDLAVEIDTSWKLSRVENIVFPATPEGEVFGA